MPHLVTPLTTEEELQALLNDIAEHYHNELDKDRAAADIRSLKFGYPRSPKKLKPAQTMSMFPDPAEPETGRLF